ncbi:hypothetical protein [Sphaerochaeta pleomorpha]|nr:hypothetical protein [Sphaerochaeta pleomorpha]
MKRCMVIVLSIVVLVGCKSTSTQTENKTQQLQNALLTAVTEASESVPATLHASLQTKDLLPPESLVLLEQKQIPRLDEYLKVWQQQVILAFRKTTIKIPDLLKPYIEQLQINNPQQLLRSSNSSVSALLNAQFGIQIIGSVQLLLANELTESQKTYEAIYDRYSIWSKGKGLLGEEALPQIAKFPTAHLATIFVELYLKQLSQEESDIRTTPVPQGTGSVYEIFQQELQP